MPAYDRQWTADADRRFAENMRVERERRGMSQQMVAVDLMGYGLNWHQTTVAKVEAGTRRVNLAEATAVASIFEMTIEDMLTDPTQPEIRSRKAINLHGRIAELESMVFHLRTRRMQVEDELRAVGAAEDAGGDTAAPVGLASRRASSHNPSLQHEYRRLQEMQRFEEEHGHLPEGWAARERGRPSPDSHRDSGSGDEGGDE